MAKETITESCSEVRAFDQSGNIRYDESAILTQINDAKMRFKSCERIVSNLWLCRRDSRYKSRFSGVRKTYQAYIGDELKLKLKLILFTRTSFLMVTGGSVGRRREMRISKSTASSARCEPGSSGDSKIMEEIAGLRIVNLSADRNTYYNILALPTGTI
jgi:hypothetical protein